MPSRESKPSFEPGTFVLTPSGAKARVVCDYPHVGEVLVEWPSNLETARFRYAHLKPVPEPA